MVTKIQDGPAIETKLKVGNFETKQKNTASEIFRKGLLDLFYVYLLCLADIICMINISKVLKKKRTSKFDIKFVWLLLARVYQGSLRHVRI